jgi:hypothetical protein
MKANYNMYYGLGLLALFAVTSLNGQQTYTFNNCGNTGRYGPSQTQANNTYSSTNLAGSVTVTTNGIQQWLIPQSGMYRITVAGARGGDGRNGSVSTAGGNGAVVRADFSLVGGQMLSIVSGQIGISSTTADTGGGGGGGSFVSLSGSPLIVAGGGGSGGDNNTGATSGTTYTYGLQGNNSGGAGGATAGSGGAGVGSSGGGGGYSTNGTTSAGGLSFVNGATGGAGTYGDGGYGGGGGGSDATNDNGAGGGGYCGGGAGGSNAAGGGGGSFIASSGFSLASSDGLYNGSTVQNLGFYNSGHGYVIIQELCSISFSINGIDAPYVAICQNNSATLTTNAISNYSWSTSSTASSIVVSPSSTTVYSLTATSTASCTTSATRTLIVNATVPSLTIATSAASVCLGKTATLTATGALTYTWTNNVTNGMTFTPAVTNVYTVTGENGCGITTATASILVGPLPVNIASSTPSVCVGSGAMITVTSAATSYSWLPQNTVTQNSLVVVSPTANTVYSVTATDGTCSGTASINLVAHPVPTITIAGTGTTVCKDGTVNLTVGGGINYTWSPSSLSGTNVTHTPTALILYQVSGDNIFGCTSGTNYIVVMQYPPALNTNVTNTTICSGSSATITGSGANSYSWSTGDNTPAISYNGITSTVVTVIGGHNTNTCTATKQVTIDVVSAVLTVGSSTTICKGASTTLSVQPANNILWIPEGGPFQTPVVSPTATTIFTVSAEVSTLSLFCPTTNTVLVTVNPTPVVTASVSRPSMCRYEINTLSASGASTYSWTNQQTGASVSYTANQTGPITVSVTGTDANGCSSTTKVQFQVNACNGLGENEYASGVKVYPVPAHDALNIESLESCTLKLISVSGQVVQVISLKPENNNRVVITGLAAGLYLLQTSDGQMLKKVIIQ